MSSHFSQAGNRGGPEIGRALDQTLSLINAVLFEVV